MRLVGETTLEYCGIAAKRMIVFSFVLSFSIITIVLNDMPNFESLFLKIFIFDRIRNNLTQFCSILILPEDSWFRMGFI